MSELARLRLARASRNWFCNTELATSADSYVRHLSQQGYASGTINAYLGSVAHFAHWCARLHIGLAVINEGTVERFLEHLPVCHCADRCQRWRYNACAALRILLALLRTEGRIAQKKSSDPAAIIEEICRFEHYLKQVCGLRPTTCSVRMQRVRAFLLERFAAGPTEIGAVRPADVVRFMAKYTESRTAPSKRAAGDSLRS
jgi:integrase/recombinase XerD